MQEFNWDPYFGTIAPSPLSTQPFGACVGAARHWRSLPDLLPSQVHRQRRIDQFRRVVIVAGPAAAVLLFGFSILFGRLDQSMRPLTSRHQARLNEVRVLIGQCTKWEATRSEADTIEGQIRAFSEKTPLWVGFYKELSVLLPSEFYAQRFDGRIVNGRLHVTILGDVYADDESDGFDQIKERMLAALVASPFCHEVREPKATRHLGGGASAGTISVEIALAYPGAGLES